MGISQLNLEDVNVRLATSDDEVRAAQRLRYKVFYEEYNAVPDEETLREKRDADDFDAVADHLIVLDESHENLEDKIVGTYRLLRREIADKHGKFYTADEYNIDPLLVHQDSALLELGRSCVLADYRTRPVLQLLWQGIIDYILTNDVDLLFGCASLYGTDVDALSKHLSYLHHYHLAPEEYRARAVEGRYVDMNIHPKESLDQKEVFSELPPLIKGYLRVGAYIGEGAVVDHQFNTTDVCIIVPTKNIASRYLRHYSRKIQEKNEKSDQAVNGKQYLNGSGG